MLAAQQRAAFDSLVQVLEKQHTIRIFYDKKQTDSLHIRPVTGNPETILREQLNGTGLQLYKDSYGRIFIYNGPTPAVSLPADYFTAVPSPKTDKEEEEEKIVKATVDNRIYTIGKKGAAGTTAVITGYIRDARNGEPVVAASVTVEGKAAGVSSDAFGFYTITLPKGRARLRISSVGMVELIRQVEVLGPGRLDLDMQEEIRSLKSALVVAPRQSNVRGLQMGVERLNLKTIKQIPAIFGETDVLRSLLTLPGVTSVGEGTVGFNVRGGSADQNLILLNDMTLFNPTHVFGLFSAVDPDVIRGLELYKSAIPERLGGRISSVMDISTKDGNSKELTGTVGIGPMTSRFMLEGPLAKEKSTILVGGRLTYSDWLIRNLKDPSFKNSRAGFQDLLLHFSDKLTDKDQLYITAYASNDRFRLSADSTYRYVNANGRIKWRHNYSDKFSHVISAGVDHYRYSITTNSNPVNEFDLGFGINQYSGRADFKYTPDNRHEITMGLQHIQYQLDPGQITPTNAASLVKPVNLQQERATESALFLGDQFRISEKFSVQGGVRFVYYRKTGPATVYIYQDGQPRRENTVIDSVQYTNGKPIANKQGPEFRFSARYLISNRASVKLSVNTLQQFIQVISNTTAISPTDIWKLSDTYIQPQKGTQFSVGYYLQPGSKGIEISVEAYYKNTKHILDYKSGARLLLNPALEREVINTDGKAYGAEFQIKKNQGKFNGWLSYTYMRSFLKVNDPLAGETINNNDFYRANFDKPHIVNLVTNYRFTQRVSLSINTTYSTGRPVTFPVGIYDVGGAPRVFYSERNAYRIPDFFRVDLSMNIENSPKLKQRFHTSWTFGVYNITGRDNPYSVYYTLENGKIKGYQLSVFATALPFVTFNLKF